MLLIVDGVQGFGAESVAELTIRKAPAAAQHVCFPVLGREQQHLMNGEEL